MSGNGGMPSIPDGAVLLKAPQQETPAAMERTVLTFRWAIGQYADGRPMVAFEERPGEWVLFPMALADFGKMADGMAAAIEELVAQAEQTVERMSAPKVEL